MLHTTASDHEHTCCGELCFHKIIMMKVIVYGSIRGGDRYTGMALDLRRRNMTPNLGRGGLRKNACMF